jgi:hypothetical protein
MSVSEKSWEKDNNFIYPLFNELSVASNDSIVSE